MSKPTSKPDWTDGASSKVSEPSGSKKLQGWLKEEPPPFNFFNWVFYNISQWINFLGGQEQYNVIISSDPDEADYASLAAYIADSPQAGDRVLIKEDEVLTATLSIPSGIQLTQLKGKKFTIATTFSPVIQFGDGVKTIGDFRLETSNTTTIAKAFSINGDNNHLDNLSLENKSTGTITAAIYIESGVEGNYAQARSINSGGGSISSSLDDNSGNDENDVTVISDDAIIRSMGANKFYSPDIADHSNAQHDHGDAAGGGDLEAKTAFHAYMSANQNIAATTFVKVAFDTIKFDTHGDYITASRRFQPSIAGKYLISATFGLDISPTPPVDQQGYLIKIRKNGALSQHFRMNASGALKQSLSVTTIEDANGSGDYFEIWAYFDVAGEIDAVPAECFFTGCKID